MIDQGITVLRYGGSMVNDAEYRWKKMIGPLTDRRPPYRGHWYPYSSNGWGIVDFVDFCEAAGFRCIPAFNMGETAQDMADFVEYVNGPADSLMGPKALAAAEATLSPIACGLSNSATKNASTKNTSPNSKPWPKLCGPKIPT